MTGRQGPAWAAALLGVGLLLGPAGAVAAAGADRRPPAGVAVDATGRVVGRLYETSPFDLSGKVVLKVGGMVATVTLRADRFGPGSNVVVFESGDCSGPAFLKGEFPAERPLFPLTGISGNLLLIENGPTQGANVASRLDPATGDCEPAALGLTDVRPTALLLDLDLFVPPFTVR